MTEHTPTPWAAEPDDREGMEWNIHIIEASRPHMRVCFMTSNGPSEANAAFIVEAVNNHEALKAENERLRSELEQVKGQVETFKDVLLGMRLDPDGYSLSSTKCQGEVG